MKRFLVKTGSVLLAVLLMVVLFTGCNLGETAKPFKDETEFGEYVKSSFWVCDAQYGTSRYFRFCVFTDSYRCISFSVMLRNGETMQDMVKRYLDELTEKGEPTSFSGVVEFAVAISLLDGTEMDTVNLQYDKENSSLRGGNAVFAFLRNGTMKHHGDVYTASQDLMELKWAFDRVYHQYKEGEKAAFLQKYPNALSYRNVKYDPLGCIAKPFVISGKAELDDYYNYEYRDMEYVYFCVEFTPTGGSFTERWYIYIDRRAHGDLYEALLNGSAGTLTFVCKTMFLDAAKNSMATMIDYYMG